MLHSGKQPGSSAAQSNNSFTVNDIHFSRFWPKRLTHCIFYNIMEERRGSTGCRGRFMPPSGEVNSPLLRQVDHLSRALFGRKTSPSKLTPCLIYVNTVITL